MDSRGALKIMGTAAVVSHLHKEVVMPRPHIIAAATVMLIAVSISCTSEQTRNETVASQTAIGALDRIGRRERDGARNRLV